jgi:MFS family permease
MVKKDVVAIKTGGHKFFYGYIVVAAGFGVWFIGFTLQNTFGVFFLPISQDFGWTHAQTSFAASLYGILLGFLALGMGWLTDRLGPRFVVTIFGSFVGISLLLLARIHTFWEFQVYFAVLGAIGTATASVPIMATISRWFVRRRGLMSGLVQSGVGLGGLIINPLAGWLILAYDWRMAYLVLGAASLAIIVTSGLFLQRDPHDIGLLPDGNTMINEPPGRAMPEAPNAEFSFRKTALSGRFWVMGGLYFAFGFCRSTFLAHTGPHVQDLGFSLADAANIMAVISVSSIVGRIGMGRVADVIGNRTALIIAYAATAVDMMWGLTAATLWGLYLYAFIFGFGWGGQAVLRYPATAQEFGLRAAGLLMGVMGLFENVLGGGIGVFLAGYIFDVTGNYQQVYWMGLAVSTMGVIFAALLKAPAPSSSPLAGRSAPD